MEENRSTYKIYDDKIGEVQIADSVIAVIAGLAALEIEGVSSLRGNITADQISKISVKKFSKGVSVSLDGNNVTVNVSLDLLYGYNIIEVSSKVQERIKSTIENMTGMNVTEVNVSAAGVNVQQ